MEEQTSTIQEKLSDWLLRIGNVANHLMLRFINLLERFWKWYQAINWPEIPLSAFQWVLLFYAIFGGIFLVSTPILEASDELWHFGMVEYIRENGELPVYDVSDPDLIFENNSDTIYRQEGSQPPLYYFTMALITSPIDISDAEEYRQPNPHVRAGETGSFGNKNLVLHSTDGTPLSGTPLAILIIRVLGLAMGAVTIWAVWQTGELLAPHRPVVGLLAGVLTAFNPMFLFISASVNNDVMVIMLNSIVILLGLQTIKYGFDTRRSVLLAVLLGLATLTKLSALVLVPVIAIFALWVARRDKNWTGVLVLGAAMFIAWASIAGWWYFRNITLYGELFGTQTMAMVAGVRPDPFTIGTFLAEFESFRQGYWGVFGAFNIITYGWFYALADFLVFIGIFGIIFLISQLVSIQDFSFARREISLVLYLLSIVIIGFISYLNWTSMTFASQGRLLFPFFAAINSLLAVGLIELLWWTIFLLSPPDRSYVRAGDAVPEPILRSSLRYPVMIAGLLIFSIPFFSIMPKYNAPQPMTRSDIPADVQQVYARYGDIELIGVDVNNRRYTPGETVRVTLYWHVIEPTEEDLTLAVALIDDPYRRVISRRTISSYPGAGTLRTSTWEAGAVYADTYELQLANSVNLRYAVDLEINWYDADPDNRLQAVNNEDDPISVILEVGAVIPPNLRIARSDLDLITNQESPQADRLFGGAILLEGYGYTPIPEDLRFDVNVLWESRDIPDNVDYATFMHVYDTEGVLITQYDLQPLQPVDLPPMLPVRYWAFGEDYRLNYPVFPPETGFAPGEYTVNVGWYLSEDPFTRLEIPLEEEIVTSYELFTFTVGTDGIIELPVLEIDEPQEPPQGAALPPVIRVEETPEATEPSAEVTAEVTQQVEVTEEPASDEE